MNLPDEPKGDKPEASFLDENRLDIHSRHELVLRTCDSNGDSRTVDQQEFWAANFAGYDMVLGWPWLAAADPMISFRTGTFVWGNAEVTRLEAVTVDQLFDGLQKGEKVYSIVAYKKQGVRMLSSHDTPTFSVNPKGIHTLILLVIIIEIPEAYYEYEDVFLDERAGMLV